MSWYQSGPWERKPSRHFGRWVRRILFFGGLAVAAVTIIHFYTSPKYVSHLPKPVRDTLAKVELKYYEKFGKDMVVFTKSLKAKKLLGKTDGLVKFRSGLTGRRQVKLFKLNGKLTAEVRVESLHSIQHARGVMKARGAENPSDDLLGIGKPSFLESHGVDDNLDYFLTATSRHGPNLVTVTLKQPLSKREQNTATGEGDGYYKLVETKADKMLQPISNISLQQMKRLEKFD